MEENKTKCTCKEGMNSFGKWAIGNYHTEDCALVIEMNKTKSFHDPCPYGNEDCPICSKKAPSQQSAANNNIDAPLTSGYMVPSPTNSWAEKLEEVVFNVDLSDRDANYLKKDILEIVEMSKQETQRELLEDMKQKMSEWHGTGTAMIEDYEKLKMIPLCKLNWHDKGSIIKDILNKKKSMIISYGSDKQETIEFVSVENILSIAASHGVKLEEK